MLTPVGDDWWSPLATSADTLPADVRLTVADLRPRPHALVGRAVDAVRRGIRWVIDRARSIARRGRGRLHAELRSIAGRARRWWEANRSQILASAALYGGGWVANALQMPGLAHPLQTLGEHIARDASPASLDDLSDYENEIREGAYREIAADYAADRLGIDRDQARAVVDDPIAYYDRAESAATDWWGGVTDTVADHTPTDPTGWWGDYDTTGWW